MGPKRFSLDFDKSFEESYRKVVYITCLFIFIWLLAAMIYSLGCIATKISLNFNERTRKFCDILQSLISEFESDVVKILTISVFFYILYNVTKNINITL